jgi:NADH:ubiquinone oxidoreductase subunit E
MDMNSISIENVINEMGGEQSPLLQVLIAIQDKSPNHYISEESVGIIAKHLGVTRGRVYSTASFYSEISLKPRGRNIIRICTNAPCENAGKKQLQDAIIDLLHIDIGETTEDQMFTLESVNCLGSCYMSPAIKINDTIFGNVKAEELPGIIDSFKRSNLPDQSHNKRKDVSCCQRD